MIGTIILVLTAVAIYSVLALRVLKKENPDGP